MAQKKKPIWKATPNIETKTPKWDKKGDSFDNERFRWRANWVDLEGEWGLAKADHALTWRQLIPRLHQYEERTWNEIFGARKTSDHPMPVTEISKAAQDRLIFLDKADYDTLYQINVQAGWRLWGIRDRQIFYLLWHDPNHTVYVQKKK